MKSYGEAIASLNQSIKHNPNNTEAIAHQGEAYRLGKQYEEALIYFNQAIAQNSTYAWAIAHRGEVYRLMKRYPQALADFNQSLELKPDYVWALAHRGVTYRLMGKHYYEKALADFSQAIDLNPNYAWALAYRARLYDLLRRYEEALVDFDRAIVLDQTVFDNWLSERGSLLSYCGQYAEAIDCCQLALQEDPKNHFALYNIAIFQARWQGLAEASTDIEKARALLLTLRDTQERGMVLYRLGGLAAIENQPEIALNYLREAILLDQEAIEFARHDVAWLELRNSPKFLMLIAEPD
ncbi:tetratricopeptide repeat protein [Nostocaceae cyanobacterium CENA357]|uniref:Tetratricopeptide repeat protein n=1 Tax=Atlanticothrix silvestris CENA357 TaxID=1725252 RepID=A0A8J7HHK1_9CYAN|nr:tetratricopeptide repeat protein [Atlanticothrix silvestris]MBH8552513.1 tetratricopeptide repeat protein [Atlanticothrix silvestris CENA357]